MASSQAIATALAMFAESFPTRELTAQTARVWATVFEDVEDIHLSRAALHICRNPEQKFFPTSGEVFAAIRATRPRRLALMPARQVEPERPRKMPMLANPDHPMPMASTIETVKAALKRETA
jgi:hypothetical protein